MVPMPKKRCPGCQKFISPTATFCIHCGANTGELNLEIENVEEANPSPPPLTAPYTAIQAQSTIENQPFAPVSNNASMFKDIPIYKVNEASEIEEEYIKDLEDSQEEYEDDETSEADFYEEEEDETDNLSDEEDEEFYNMLNASTDLSKNSDSVLTTDEPKKEATLPIKNKLDVLKDNLFVSKKSISNAVNQKKEKLVSKQCSDDLTPEVKTSSSSYNPNSDGYYDNVTAQIDAEIEHIKAENVIKTISIAVTFILIVVFFLFFI